MKIDFDRDFFCFQPDGNDSPVVNGIPQGAVIVARDGTVTEVWEAGGKLHWRKTTADDLEERSASQML